MLTVFEVYLAAGADPNGLLSDETRRETQAQVMTAEEASQVGFSGIQRDEGGLEMRLIAVNSRDKAWIVRVLESNEGVARFRIHDVDA